MSNTHTNRESWLRAAAEAMSPWLEELGYPMPARWQVSVGFTKYGSPNAIGQCWPPTCTGDDTTSIFIDPRIEEPILVLDVLLHEQVHAAVGCDCGHKGPFVKTIRALGLQGKATATFSGEGTELRAKIEALAEILGPYPHSAMKLERKQRPPGGGWIKLKSETDPEYILRISPKAIELGLPKDPWGQEMVEAATEE